MKPWRMQDIDSLCQPGRLTPSVDPAILWVAPAIRIHGFYAPTGRSPLRPSLSPWRPCWLTIVAAQPPLTGPSCLARCRGVFISSGTGCWLLVLVLMLRKETRAD